MAHIIYTQENKLFKIAETDAHKNAINGIENYNAVSISDSDFAKIKRNELFVGDYDSTNSQHSTTVMDITGSLNDEGNPLGSIYNADSLSSYLKNIENQLKDFCEVPSNSSNPLFTICNNYWDYLKHNSMEEHDFTASPIYSWEKYCEDNSISYIHPLQIP
jgi:hypothetical protein